MKKTHTKWYQVVYQNIQILFGKKPLTPEQKADLALEQMEKEFSVLQEVFASLKAGEKQLQLKLGRHQKLQKELEQKATELLQKQDPDQEAAEKILAGIPKLLKEEKAWQQDLIQLQEKLKLIEQKYREHQRLRNQLHQHHSELSFQYQSAKVEGNLARGSVRHESGTSWQKMEEFGDSIYHLEAKNEVTHGTPDEKRQKIELEFSELEDQDWVQNKLAEIKKTN